MMVYYTANRCLLQDNGLEESQDKILLPPTDPNAEVLNIVDYKLVYVKGACPKIYRVYRDDSMVGLLFQHITHWSNEVDEIRYAKPRDAVVGLEDSAGAFRGSDTEQKPITLQGKERLMGVSRP